MAEQNQKREDKVENNHYLIHELIDTRHMAKKLNN